MKTLLAVLFSGLALVAVSSAQTAQPAAVPHLQFTAVPPGGQGSDSQGDIAGTVTGVPHPEQYRIVLYAHTDRWYVQPLANQPLTAVADNGSWSTWTHLGARYGALLVASSYHAADTLESLPVPGEAVLAVAETPAGR